MSESLGIPKFAVHTHHGITVTDVSNRRGATEHTCKAHQTSPKNHTKPVNVLRGSDPPKQQTGHRRERAADIQPQTLLRFTNATVASSHPEMELVSEPAGISRTRVVSAVLPINSGNGYIPSQSTKERRDICGFNVSDVQPDFRWEC